MARGDEYARSTRNPAEASALFQLRDLPLRGKKLRLAHDGSAADGEWARVERTDADDRRRPLEPVLNVADSRPDPVTRRLDMDSGADMCHSLRSAGPRLTRQGRLYANKMVIAVADRMILQEELASEWRVTVERDGCGTVEFVVGKGSDRRGRSPAIGFQQCECGFFGDVVILFCVVPVDRVDSLPRDTRDWLPGGEQTGKLNLNWVHTGDVVYDDSDFPSVLGKVRLPLRLRQRGREKSKRCCSVLQASSKGFR